MGFFGIVTASVRKTFTDTFVRSNTSGGPGRASDGSLWDATRGTMVVTSNTLTTPDSVSGYPMVTTDMGVENVQIEVSATNTGQLASLWVTDSNNWWGVQTFSQAESCNCYTYYYSCNCSAYYYQCNCTTTYFCANWGCGSYQGAYFCNTCQSYGSYSSCSTCTGYSCSTCSDYACSTCYPNYMRVLRSVSGSVSAVYTWTLASLAAAFRVKTSGDAITMQAYSNSNLTSQIGSDTTYTASSPAKTKRFGLSIGPSSYNQGSSISNVIIKRNP
jgi:hypothetical protein